MERDAKSDKKDATAKKMIWNSLDQCLQEICQGLKDSFTPEVIRSIVDHYWDQGDVKTDADAAPVKAGAGPSTFTGLEEDKSGFLPRGRGRGRVVPAKSSIGGLPGLRISEEPLPRRSLGLRQEVTANLPSAEKESSSDDEFSKYEKGGFKGSKWLRVVPSAASKGKPPRPRHVGGENHKVVVPHLVSDEWNEQDEVTGDRILKYVKANTVKYFKP